MLHCLQCMQTAGHACHYQTELHMDFVWLMIKDTDKSLFVQFTRMAGCASQSCTMLEMTRMGTRRHQSDGPLSTRYTPHRSVPAGHHWLSVFHFCTHIRAPKIVAGIRVPVRDMTLHLCACFANLSGAQGVAKMPSAEDSSNSVRDLRINK